MIMTTSVAAASVISFGPLPAGWCFDRLEVAANALDGSANASLVLSAGFMRDAVKTSGLVAANSPVPIIASGSTVFTYTAVATNVAPGPVQRIALPAFQPDVAGLPLQMPHLAVDLTTVTNCRVVVSVFVRKL